MKQKNKKIIYVLFNDGPSATVRAKIYENSYKKNGYQVDYFYAYSRALSCIIRVLENRRKLILLVRIINRMHMVIKGWKEFILLNKLVNYQGVIIIKYATSKLLKNIRNRTKAKLLYDYDDAVWLDKYFFGKEEYEKILKLADYISVDNNYLYDKAKIYNPKAFVLNGPVQIELFDNVRNNKIKKENQITIGWIGSPTTLFYLQIIHDVIERIGQDNSQVVLKLVGVGHDNKLIPRYNKIKCIYVPEYNQKEMVRQVLSFDVGLFPINEDELSLGRGVLKATIYMAAKVPVIASAIGENNNLIADGYNGYLAVNQDDWLKKLSTLVRDAKLRDNIGRAGYERVKRDYSLDNCFKQLSENYLQKI